MLYDPLNLFDACNIGVPFASIVHSSCRGDLSIECAVVNLVWSMVVMYLSIECSNHHATKAPGLVRIQVSCHCMAARI